MYVDLRDGELCIHDREYVFSGKVRKLPFFNRSFVSHHLTVS